MLPALLPLRSCVCGVVQGVKSSSQPDPFRFLPVLLGAVHAKPRRLKCSVRRVRVTDRDCSFLGLLSERALVPKLWVLLPQWWA